MAITYQNTSDNGALSATSGLLGIGQRAFTQVGTAAKDLANYVATETQRSIENAQKERSFLEQVRQFNETHDLAERKFGEDIRQFGLNFDESKRYKDALIKNMEDQMVLSKAQNDRAEAAARRDQVDWDEKQADRQARKDVIKYGTDLMDANNYLAKKNSLDVNEQSVLDAYGSWDMVPKDVVDRLSKARQEVSTIETSRPDLVKFSEQFSDPLSRNRLLTGTGQKYLVDQYARRKGLTFSEDMLSAPTLEAAKQELATRERAVADTLKLQEERRQLPKVLAEIGDDMVKNYGFKAEDVTDIISKLTNAQDLTPQEAIAFMKMSMGNTPSMFSKLMQQFTGGPTRDFDAEQFTASIRNFNALKNNNFSYGTATPNPTPNPSSGGTGSGNSNGTDRSGSDTPPAKSSGLNETEIKRAQTLSQASTATTLSTGDEKKSLEADKKALQDTASKLLKEVEDEAKKRTDKVSKDDPAYKIMVKDARTAFGGTSSWASKTVGLQEQKEKAEELYPDDPDKQLLYVANWFDANRRHESELSKQSDKIEQRERTMRDAIKSRIEQSPSKMRALREASKRNGDFNKIFVDSADGYKLSPKALEYIKDHPEYADLVK